jgi:hypothetical protein
MNHATNWIAALVCVVAINVHAATTEPAVSDDLAPQATANTSEPESLVPVADRRGVEQTLLTFPEWNLVSSPAEYARMVQTRPAHDYPFVRDIGQVWSGYAHVGYEQWRRGYPMNPGYHLMIGVLAASTTVEYGVKAVYGNTVGRLSWVLGGSRQTAEDRFDAQTAQDYVEFIEQTPWYLYPFGAKLKELWTDVPMEGSGQVRKIERRLALTGEYGVKALYGKIIRVATHAVYDAPQMTTDVVVARLPDGWTAPAKVRVLQRFADGRALLSLPRYYDFRDAATALARDGIQITDVAGNQSVILVSVWVPVNSADSTDSGRVLFTQSIETPANVKRVVMLIPVRDLSTLLASAGSKGWQVEHVYDY